MTQQGLALDLSTEHTRRREFLEEMRRVAPRSTLIALIEPHYPKGPSIYCSEGAPYNGSPTPYFVRCALRPARRRNQRQRQLAPAPRV